MKKSEPTFFIVRSGKQLFMSQWRNDFTDAGKFKIVTQGLFNDMKILLFNMTRERKEVRK